MLEQCKICGIERRHEPDADGHYHCVACWERDKAERRRVIAPWIWAGAIISALVVVLVLSALGDPLIKAWIDEYALYVIAAILALFVAIVVFVPDRRKPK